MGRRYLGGTLGPGLVVVGLALSLAAGTPWAMTLAASVTCVNGRCNGTQQDDVITGTVLENSIRARGGNDVVDAGDGFDFVLGGAGDDELHGGGQGDEIAGGPGIDTLDGGGGADLLFAGGDEPGASDTDPSDEVLDGGSGGDYMEGGSGNDTLFGGDGDESEGRFIGMHGNLGDDELHGGDGADRISGDQGNDELFGDDGDDYLQGVSNESPGSVDQIHCGDGFDEANANVSDIVDGDCEVVTIQPDATAAGAAARARAAGHERTRALAAFRARQARERAAAGR